MNWIRIARHRPPTNKKLLIACGYIFDDNDYSIDGYDIKTFEDYELGHLETANNGKYCFFKGDTAIAFWCEIKKPILNATQR